MNFVSSSSAPWFPINSLQAWCEKGAWSRGMDLFRQAAVVHIDIEERGDSAFTIHGEVQGTQPEPYGLSVELQLAPNGQVSAWSGECSCPVGEDCKHAVALTLKAAHLRSGPALAPSSAPLSAQAVQALQAMQDRVAAQARAEAEARLVRWLHDWDLAADNAVPPPPGARADRPECYLYLLSTVGRLRSGAPQLQIEAVVSYAKVTGGWAKPKTIRTQPGPGQAVYDRATDADRQLLQLLRAMPRSLGYYSAYSGAPSGVLEGTVGLLALQQAAATGRLFADAGGATVGAPLRWGDALPIAWAWNETPAPQADGDSAWRLQARLPNPSAALCARGFVSAMICRPLSSMC